MKIITSRVRKCTVNQEFIDRKMRLRTKITSSHLIPLRHNLPFQGGDEVVIMATEDLKILYKQMEETRKTNQELQEEINNRRVRT